MFRLSEKRVLSLLLLACLLCDGTVAAFAYTRKTCVPVKRGLSLSSRSSTLYQAPKRFGTNLYEQRNLDDDLEGPCEENQTKRRSFRQFGRSLSRRAVSSVNKMRGKNYDNSDNCRPLPINESEKYLLDSVATNPLDKLRGQ
eukprot:11785908-Ditylum_brightwellii.AAC.1